MTFSERNRAIWQSYRSLPLWVQIWVGLILAPANAGWLLVWGSPIGDAAFWAALFVVATNLPIMYAYAGMNRLMSIPHLIAWGPLQVYIAWRLWCPDAATEVPAAEYLYGLILFVINGISVIFDLMDSWLWIKGERETVGQTSN